MPPPTKCQTCGLELGEFVETRCPQCGMSTAPKPPVTLGMRILDLMITVCVALFGMGSFFGFIFYLNSSERAELYTGQPYHATTFRVYFVQYAKSVCMGDSGCTLAQFRATGFVEGQKETMDLLPYLGVLNPQSQEELMTSVPEGTVIPVYLFPALHGTNRIQTIGSVPPAQAYQRQANWMVNRGLSLLAIPSVLGVLLVLLRRSIIRRQLAAMREFPLPAS